MANEAVINSTETHTVPTIPCPIRLQEYGVGIFKAALTKSALKKALKKKFIRVNDVVATSATFITGGEQIVLSIPEGTVKKRELIFPLDVLFEDEHLAVIHKPAGILVSGNGFKTIANALPTNIALSTLADAAVPQPVHRLDYPTTGALLAGKTSSSIRALNGLFEDKKVKKTYYAVAIGEMNPSGTISTAIEDKPSLTNYEVVETVPSKRFGKLNLVKVEPETGRRHQIRIHLASIGNPILGDKEYGIEPLILNGKGLYLHAFALEFGHPFSGELVLVKAGFPKGFGKIFDVNSAASYNH